jgi:23S rRNA G2069 N7-methylase RlmK/C1962 C5-methylase RlmI
MKAQTKKHKYITKNIDIIRTLIRSGDMSGTVISQYKIYLVFQIKTHQFRMQRYQDTAEDCRCSLQTVMNAVKSMESNIYQM